MLFQNGIFSPQRLNDERATAVLEAATGRATEMVKPSDFLAATIAGGDPRILITLSQALEPGVTPQNLLEVIEVYNPARTTPSEFDGRRERFTPEAQEALDQFSANLEEAGEQSRNMALELLLNAVLSHLDQEDQAFLTRLDASRAATLFKEQVSLSAGLSVPLFDIATGRLRSEEFTDGAWAALENAALHATALGYDRILPPHAFLALLGETEGIAEHLVRLQAPFEIGPGRVMEMVADSLRLSDRKGPSLELTRNDLGESMVAILRATQKTACLWRSERIDTSHLLWALLEEMPPRLASILEQNPLHLNLTKMREHLGQEMRETQSQVRRELAFRLPAGFLPSEDLTYRARTEGYPPALHVDNYLEDLCRSLSRRTRNHALITGLRGVGKTTLIRELARRAAAREIPFLRRKRLMWVDCRDVDPQESKGKLEDTLAYVAGRTDVLLCLDDLGPLLRAESGGSNKLMLRRALKEGRTQLVGAMSKWDFEDLLASDHELLELFTQVEVVEPEESLALDMVKQASTSLEQDYQVTIDKKAMERAVVLSASYILNERLPLKAIKVLERACEDLHYEIGKRQNLSTTVTVAEVIDIISDISGVPVSTLSGIVEKVDYEHDLAAEIAGQEEAVKAVAMQLSLIKGGATDPTKPASVMFFAGLTGVGKTELAKVLARFYSSSKRLQTYTMGNFTQPHTISGIIGVPAGYVGHEQGGRLVNDLNSDPYCVFLLDEAEKAHPDIWKPFLNLFDEAWIVDTRGVKAFADKAIFILTSNAGQQIIAQKYKAKEPMEKIIEAVKQHLSEIRQEHSREPVFPPEFLARITQIIVFKPLDETAMEGICHKLVSQIQKNWQGKREKILTIPESLIKYISRQGMQMNERSGGKEGGRIVRKLLQELVEATIQREAMERDREYRQCQKVELIFMPPPPPLPQQPPPTPKVQVKFIFEALPPARSLELVLGDLHQAISATTVDLSQQTVQDCLVRLEASLDRWLREHPEEESPPWRSNLMGDFHEAAANLNHLSSQTAQEVGIILQRLVTALQGRLAEIQR